MENWLVYIVIIYHILKLKRIFQSHKVQNNIANTNENRTAGNNDTIDSNKHELLVVALDIDWQTSLCVDVRVLYFVLIVAPVADTAAAYGIVAGATLVHALSVCGST